MLVVLVSVAPLIYSLPRGALITNLYKRVRDRLCGGGSRALETVIHSRDPARVPALVFLLLSTTTRQSAYYDMSLGFNIALYTAAITISIEVCLSTAKS